MIWGTKCVQRSGNDKMLKKCFPKILLSVVSMMQSNVSVKERSIAAY